jgi:GT2 family glycosyltransferase
MAVISICIVNYNSSNLLKSCLESIFRYPPRCPFEVIVIDNNSSDDVEDVAVRFPNVCFIRNRANVGFAVANNQALGLAGGEIFMLLNPDTEVQPGALDALLSCFQKNPGAGLISAKLLNPDATPQIGFNVRRLPTLASAAAQLLLIEECFPSNPITRRSGCFDLDQDAVQEVEQPAASALLWPRRVWETVGGFDERFINWYNDVDLCKRIHDAGRPILFCPEAKVLHHLGMGSAARPIGEGIVESYRALRLYFLKHHGALHYYAVNCLLVIGMTLRVAVLKMSPRTHKRVFVRAERSSGSVVKAFATVLWDTLSSWRASAVERPSYTPAR